jgi:twitching motility protein PilT
VPDLQHYLHQLLEHRSSDLHLKVGSVPHVRIDGRLTPLLGAPLSVTDLEGLVTETVPHSQVAELERNGDLDFAVSVAGVGRFRVNVHRQRGTLGMVVRCVPPGLPSWEQLGLPPSVRRLADADEGLVVLAGPAGSGRSTTAAMLVDHVNSSRAVSIVTVERPIEVLHTDKRSLVVQREVGMDTPSFFEGIRHVLHQDCEVLYVSELVDRAVARAVLSAASSGRLVIVVLSATSAVGAVRSFIELFEDSERATVRRSLARVLRGVSVQQLVERLDGFGRVPACEVLVATGRVGDILLDPTVALEHLDRVIAEGEYHGMRTMQGALYELCVERIVPDSEATRLAPAAEDLRLALSRAGLSAS